jgi:CRISPR-associated protein Cas6
MYWEDDDNQQPAAHEKRVVDVSFRIDCRALPVDHAHALSSAVLNELPWLADEPEAGVHSIHVADSGNGWMRPENPDDLVFPSRRTRMTLRVPSHRTDDAQALVGCTLDIAGNSLEVGESTIKDLTAVSTLFARYLVAMDDDDEESFLADIATQLKELGIRPKKMMCGISKTIQTPDDTIRTRSLMLADLSHDDSVLLQQSGLGEHRHLGCGIFIPHKDINKLHDLEKEKGG